jgi:hypothetical protein
MREIPQEERASYWNCRRLSTYWDTLYVSTLLGCDPKTIRQGQQDLDQLPDGLGERVRQKGADESPV